MKNNRDPVAGILVLSLLQNHYLFIFSSCLNKNYKGPGGGEMINFKYT
jgi:hypothetical protein